MTRDHQHTEYSLTLEIPPPPTIFSETVFPLPVIVAISTPDITKGRARQYLVAHASLRNHTGSSPVPVLRGNLTSCVACFDSNSNTGYAVFSGLKITEPRQYMLRILLGAATPSGVIIRQYVDSEVFQVQENSPTRHRPTPAHMAVLTRLIAKGLDMEIADVAAFHLGDSPMLSRK
ncbi:hypothetical protein BO78DRAFT_309907 [Aspergillus sclerotiicarbonarius CBS 121057]|uniref:Velvet domain-containing protein n=1 Tax=Aspergillus sclerotiicarbonarius (strain CBS 121057 / IBT 28362) TaxID=1448318 RepID=A0A319EF55_ASPSB|nr:hypothetical protein BO78DRAFT_309907 [Aspergillus sclerotiicarbonarius CBS 121057]